MYWFAEDLGRLPISIIITGRAKYSISVFVLNPADDRFLPAASRFNLGVSEPVPTIFGVELPLALPSLQVVGGLAFVALCCRPALQAVITAFLAWLVIKVDEVEILAPRAVIAILALSAIIDEIATLVAFVVLQTVS